MQDERKTKKELIAELQTLRKLNRKLVKSQTEESDKRQSQRSDDQKRFLSIADSLSDAFYTVDNNGKITYWNKAAEKMFGYTRKDILGKKNTVLMPPEAKRINEKGLEKYLKTGKGTIFGKPAEGTAVRKDGAKFPVEVCASSWKEKGRICFGAILRDLTDRRKSETEKNRQSDLLNNIFDTMADGFVLTDQFGIMTMVNNAITEMVGYSRDEIIGKRTTFLNPPGHTLSPMLETLFKEGVLNNYITTWQKKDGSLIPIECNITIIKNSQGAVSSIISCVRDISERVANEKVISEGRDFLENLFFTIPDGLAVTDTDGRIVKVNSAIVNMLGYLEEDLIGMTGADMVPEGYETPPLFDELSGTGFVRNYEIIWQKKNGDVFPVQMNISLIKDMNGQATGAVAVVRDVSEVKRSEDSLIKLNYHLDNIIENSMGGIIVTDEKAVITRINNYLIDLLGYDPDEMLGRKIFDIMLIEEGEYFSSTGLKVNIGSEYTREVKKMMSVLSEKEKISEWEIWIKRKDGIVVQVEENISFLRDISGNRIGAVGVVIDISARKRDEKQMRETKEYLEKIYQTITDGILITEADGYITEANIAFENMLGFSSEELVGKHISELYPFADQDQEYKSKIAAWMDELFEKGFTHGLETCWVRKDGSLCYIEANASLLLDENGERYGTVSSIRDISKRKKIEADKEALELRLRQVQKMEAIGTLAGGIAHDFNNILSAVMGYTELSLDDVPEGSRPYNTMKEVLIAGRRARDLVDQILAFSRHTEHNNIPMKLIPIIKETVRFLKATLPSTIRIKTRFDVQSDRVFSDPTKIHQVIMNLSTNAAYAMREKGGELCISLDEKEILPEEVVKYDEVLPGPYIILSVSDTGSGMPPEVMSRIFNPFFTTKPPGEGSGMGLSVVHGIVKSCKGDIRFESMVGKGSCFDIYLPQILEASDVDESLFPEEVPTGDERILLVDDEALVANMMQEILGRLGYKVTVVYGSLEAFDLFNQKTDDYDLIITDQTMPDMTGIQLAKAVFKIDDQKPVILCTGFSESMSDDNLQSTGIRTVLNKPVVKLDIAKAVRQALGDK